MVADAKYIIQIRKKLTMPNLTSYISRIKNLNVLVIGDTIIDEYVFVTPKGRAIKDPILSVEYLNQELYAGGVLAVVNHISSYVNNVQLVTMLGDKDSKIDFIGDSVGKNVKIKSFEKKNSPTTVKKRYVDAYKNHKLFKIEYIDDLPIEKTLSDEVVNYLSSELPKYDLVLVADFGHGFINNSIRDILEQKSKFLSINVQSNSANMGYNYINHYKKVNFISMNDAELRLPLMMRFEPIEDVIFAFNKKFGYDKFLLTLGKKGSVFYNNEKLTYAPILIDKVVDTVGAGDALFAISSLFAYLDVDDEVIPFIANCAGGIKANYIGNKESVTKEKLIKFIESLYQNVE